MSIIFLVMRLFSVHKALHVFSELQKKDILHIKEWISHSSAQLDFLKNKKLPCEIYEIVVKFSVFHNSYLSLPLHLLNYRP